MKSGLSDFEFGSKLKFNFTTQQQSESCKDIFLSDLSAFTFVERTYEFSARFKRETNNLGKSQWKILKDFKQTIFVSEREISEKFYFLPINRSNKADQEEGRNGSNFC